MSMQNLIEIQPNMEVFTADAVHVGRVKSVRDTDMLVDRKRGRDVFIPFTFIDRVIDTERRIELSLSDDAYGAQDWEHPSIA